MWRLFCACIIRPASMTRSVSRYSLRAMLFVVSAIAMAMALDYTLSEQSRVARRIESCNAAVELHRRWPQLAYAAPERWDVIVSVRWGPPNMPSAETVKRFLNAVQECDQIQSVEIFNVPLADDDLARFARCASLRDVYLEGTKITGWGLVHLKDSQVEFLSLARSRIDGRLKGVIKQFPQLKSLDLEGAQICEAVAFEVSGLTALIEINVSGTTIDDRGAASVLAIATLEHAYLAATPIGDEAMSSFDARNSLLTVLDVSGTRIGDAGAMRLVGMQHLRDLYLAHTRVTDRVLDTIAEMRSLHFVDLRGTGVTDQGLQSLSARCPDLAIEYSAGPAPIE